MSISRTMAKSTAEYLQNGTPAQTDNGLSITTRHNMDALTDIMLPEARKRRPVRFCSVDTESRKRESVM